jgi:hypothetical protein
VHDDTPLEELTRVGAADPTRERPVATREEQLADEEREHLRGLLFESTEASTASALLDDVLHLLEEREKDHPYPLNELGQPVLRRVDEVLQHHSGRLLSDQRDSEETPSRLVKLLDPFGGERDVGPDLDRVVPDPISPDNQTFENSRGVEGTSLHKKRGDRSLAAGKRCGLQEERAVIVLVKNDEVPRS